MFSGGSKYFSLERGREIKKRHLVWVLQDWCKGERGRRNLKRRKSGSKGMGLGFLGSCMGNQDKVSPEKMPPVSPNSSDCNILNC